MKYFKLEKNLVITYVIHLSLQFHLFTVFIMAENRSLTWDLKYELIPPAFKQINSLSGFKKAIKEWKPSNCPCRLCKTYISQVGFL